MYYDDINKMVMGYKPNKITTAQGTTMGDLSDEQLALGGVYPLVGIEAPAGKKLGEIVVTDGIASYELLDKNAEELAEEAAQTLKQMEKALDAYIDSVAREKRYDNRITATMRAGYLNPWQQEGLAFGQWMDSCYVKAHEILAEVYAGTRAIPTAEELIAEMPEMVWPT